MTAQHALEEAIGHLGAAIVQSMPSDDQIIMDHVKAAHAILTDCEPVAWIVRWSTKHTPKNASAYLNEADAKRAAVNVRMYADASDVVVIPTFSSRVPSRECK